MDYYGYSIWHDILLGSEDWLAAYDLGKASDLDFEESPGAWQQLFSGLDRVLQESGLKGKMGGCLHYSSNMGAFLSNPQFDANAAFQTAKKDFESHVPLISGMHSAFGSGERVTEGKFLSILTHDLQYAQLLGASVIVEHMPDGKEINLKKLVEELTSPAIIQLLKSSSITLAWENLGPSSPAGSLKFLIDFRAQLGRELARIGESQLLDRHQFCLDTGHLLLYLQKKRFKQPGHQREIDRYLPIFAANILVFHLHANDGTQDFHLVPGSTKFMAHPSRKGLHPKKFLDNSILVLAWLKLCGQQAHLPSRHIHVEALRAPFDYEQLIAFGRQVRDLL